MNAENLGREDEAERYFRLAMRTELDQKIDVLRHALETSPRDAQVHYDLGTALVMNGELDGVRAHFQEALRLDTDFVPALDGLAWILATHPDKDEQDVPQAIDLATRSVELTKSRNASALDTLAMAHAMAGDFGEAIRLAQQALELAKTHRSRHVRPIQTRLSLYQRMGQRRRVTVPAPRG
jgi:tetratricopeptide (TPR) repeat protein